MSKYIRNILKKSIFRDNYKDISYKSLLAFCHIPKTAGVTINYILTQSFGFRHFIVLPKKNANFYSTVYSSNEYRKLQRLLPNLVSIAGHQIKPHSDLHDICPNIRYFIFIREPIQRTASYYQYQVLKGNNIMPFKNWAELEHHNNLQTKYIAGCDDVDLAIRILDDMFFVGLVEFFNESIVMLRKKIGNKNFNINYESKNVSSSSYIKNKLLKNPNTRNILDKINQGDKILYQYVREKLYPRYKKEFGDKLNFEVELFVHSNNIHPFKHFKTEVIHGLHFIMRNSLNYLLIK